MTPWLDDGDVRLYHGDALAVLAALPAESVQTCVTSPPYWGLRDYGTGEWDGGDPDCDHLMPEGPKPGAGRRDAARRQVDGFNGPVNPRLEEKTYRDVCGRCGARRVDSQLGLEPSPDAYVAAMVAVFREVRRVLRPDGTCWLNLGDSYASSPPGNTTKGVSAASTLNGIGSDRYRESLDAGHATKRNTIVAGLKPKDLVGIPWRVAFALQADSWYLRSDIVWSKPNPMPESVTDRPTKAHEYVFLLSKGPRYYYDQEAIREAPVYADPTLGTKNGHERGGWVGGGINDGRTRISTGGGVGVPEAGRNARSVWTIATQPTPEAHFATYPEELVRRCILAGTSEAGECSVCGAPWTRQVERTPMVLERSERTHPMGHTRSSGTMVSPPSSVTTGWAPSCACGAPPRPQQVLDPFVGSGTTALVARRHGRRAIGIDLNESYLGIAARRTAQLSLLAEGGAA